MRLAPRTPSAPAAARAVLAGLIAASGPIGAVRGWGDVLMSPMVARAGQTHIALSIVAWVALATWSARTPRRWALTLAAFVALGMAATAANVGRAPMLVALSGAALATAALVTGPTWAPSTSRARAPLALALSPLVVAQIAWIWWGRLPTVAALAACAAVLELGRRRPHLGSGTRRRWREVRWRARAAGRADVADPRWRAAVPALAVATAIAASWTPAIARLAHRPTVFVLGINDYQRHLEEAQRFALVPFHVGAPHLTFHVLTRVATPVLGAEWAPVLVLSLAVAAAVLAAANLLSLPCHDGHRLSAIAAVLMAGAYFLAETPALLLHATGIAAEDAPYLTVHWWGNPTWLMGLPFLFATVPLVQRLIDVECTPGAPVTNDEGRRPRYLLLAACVMAGALAKPSFVLVLVPALPTYLLAVRRAPARAVVAAVAWVSAPGAAVIAWQTWFLGSGQSTEFRSGWTFDPIVQPAFGWDRAGPAFWLPVFWVVLALLVTHGAFLRDPGVPVVLTCTAFALPLMLTVRETGEKAFDGNMAVPMQACTTLLVLLAVRACAVHVAGTWRTVEHRWHRPPPSVLAVSLLGVAFLAGGLLSHLDALGIVDVPTDWQDVPAAR